MSFKSVKKSAYNTITDAFNTVSTGVSVANKGLQYADNWMEDALTIQEAGREEKVKNALELQKEEFKQERRDAYNDSIVARSKFIEALQTNETKLNTLKETLSAETLEKYGDLL